MKKNILKAQSDTDQQGSGATNAAGRTELLLKKPKPFVLQTALQDFYVSYQINAYTRQANEQAMIYSELHQSIHMKE